MNIKTLEKVLMESGYFKLAKDGIESLPYDHNIQITYKSDDVVEFIVTDYIPSTTYKVQYNFSTKDMALIGKSNWDHPVKFAHILDPESTELNAIYDYIEITHKKSSLSYLNLDEDHSSFVILPNGDWHTTFDMDVNTIGSYKKISYINGKFIVTSVDCDDSGRCTSNTTKNDISFDSYDEMTAYWFQQQTVDKLPLSIENTLDVLNKYYSE